VTAASSVASGAVADAIAAKPSDQRHGAGRDGRQRRQVALLGDAREHASHGVARRRRFGPVLDEGLRHGRLMQQRACLLACVGGEDAPITLGADGRQKNVAA